jgi:hypothetical protein
MIRNAASHRWCPFKPLVAPDQSGQSQAFVLYAEVVDAANLEKNENLLFSVL